MFCLFGSPSTSNIFFFALSLKFFRGRWFHSVDAIITILCRLNREVMESHQSYYIKIVKKSVEIRNTAVQKFIPFLVTYFPAYLHRYHQLILQSKQAPYTSHLLIFFFLYAFEYHLEFSFW